MLTQRLGSETQKDPAFLAELIAAIQAHPGSCDEVWLATDYGFPSMGDAPRQRGSAGENRGKISRHRRAGIAAIEQFPGAWAIHVGPGTAAAWCTRARRRKIWSATEASGRTIAFAGAARMCANTCGRNFRCMPPPCSPIPFGSTTTCGPQTISPWNTAAFAKLAWRSFGARYGVEISREALVRAINRGEAVWRARWVEFVREGLRDFTDEMARAIHAVSPDSAIGLQGCAHGAYTGYGYDFLYSAMREATGQAGPKSRPGGGAYNDHNPLAFLEKAVLLNWQNEMLPAYVREIRPEIENLPDVPMANPSRARFWKPRFTWLAARTP